MRSLLLICALVSLLLLGCTSLRERQEHTRRFLHRVADVLTEGMSRAREARETFLQHIAGTAESIQATARELQQRAEQLQGGAAKVSGALEEIREGVEDVRGALNVSGESGRVDGE